MEQQEVDLIEHQDYCVFPNNAGEYIVITNDGNGKHQVPAGQTRGIDQILRYDKNEEPIDNGQVSLGVTLSEMAGEEASAVFYADAGLGSENAILHKKKYNLEIEVSGEKFRGDVALNTGLSVVSTIPDSTLMYPEQAPEDSSVSLPPQFTHDDMSTIPDSTLMYPEQAPEDSNVSLPPQFTHDDMRTISLQENNSFETDDADIDDFVESQLEGLNKIHVNNDRELIDRDFAGLVKAGLDVEDSHEDIVIPVNTRRSTQWVLDNLDRELFFLEDYDKEGEVKGLTYITERIEERNETSLTPAVRTKEDISNGNGTITHHGPEGPDFAAEFYLVNDDEEVFPAPNYVVVDKMIGEGEFLIERTDEILEHNEGNERPDSSPGFQ